MNAASIEQVATTTDAAALDELLWRVLWEPLGLPRNVRQEFSVDGDALELVAKENGQIVGGLVAVWTADSKVELRHLAVAPYAQHRGHGRCLVAELIRIAVPKGCRRIHTIARNTSSQFFQQLGFRTAPGKAPEHLAFIKQGITFKLMERIVEPAGAGDSLAWASSD